MVTTEVEITLKVEPEDRRWFYGLYSMPTMRWVMERVSPKGHS